MTQQDTQPPAETLAECPFCGGAAQLKGANAPEYWVACPGFGCKASTEGFGSKDRAIAAWNRRAALTRRAGGDAIPAGMKPWHGGDAAPADWDLGAVLGADGKLYEPDGWDGEIDWRHNLGKRGIGVDIIAYTPKPPAGDDAGAVRLALSEAIGALQPFADADEGDVNDADHMAVWPTFKVGDLRRAVDAITVGRAALVLPALPAPVVEGDERLREALAGAFRLVDGIAGAMNGVPNEPTSDQADVIAEDLAELLNVPFDENWPAAVAAALSEGRTDA